MQPAVTLTRRSLLTFAAVATGCTRPNSDGEGARYLAALDDAIRGAARIVVSEHSFELDAYDMEKGRSLLPEPLVYRTVELSAAQRHAFLAAMTGLDTRTQDAFAACIFQPHHSVFFHAKDGLQSTMKICFTCSQVQWDATSATPPWSLFRGLGSAIEALGMEPSRDWPALAQTYLQGLAGAADEKRP